MERGVGWSGPARLAALLPAAVALIPAPLAAYTIIDAPVAVETSTDDTDRLTVPVHVNGQGPFPFIVDTGADRTVVSDQLAQTLALPSYGRATLHSMSGVSQVNLVLIDKLDVSTRQNRRIAAPALARDHLGGVGMLGIDSLAGQRITLDLRANTMSIEPGQARPQLRRAEDDDGTVIVVRAKRREGQLILTDARVGNARVRVVIDTGAQTSVGNSALRRALLRNKPADPSKIDLVSVMGEKTTADVAYVPQMTIGALKLTNLPIAFVDAHPFRRFGLDRRPALLLGMDVIGAMDRVSIDFASRTVRFVLRGEAG